MIRFKKLVMVVVILSVIICPMQQYFTGDIAVQAATKVTKAKKPTISLNKKAIVLQESKTYSLTAIASDKKGVVYASSDELVAKVSTKGKITAVTTGTVIITAHLKSDKNIKKTCEVTVVPKVVEPNIDGVKVGDSIATVKERLLNASTVKTDKGQYVAFVCKDYKRFYYILTDGSNVIGIFTNKSGVISNLGQYDIGKSYASSNDVELTEFKRNANIEIEMLVDKNDNGREHMIYLSSKGTVLPRDEEYLKLCAMLTLHVTNAERAEYGFKPLSASSNADKAAIAHAQDMADNNYFSHTGLNGSRSWERLEACKVYAIYSGENIAAGFASSHGYVDLWMNSSGHRTNMLDASFTHLGVGMGRNTNSEYEMYAVHNFFGKQSWS